MLLESIDASVDPSVIYLAKGFSIQREQDEYFVRKTGAGEQDSEILQNLEWVDSVYSQESLRKVDAELVGGQPTHKSTVKVPKPEKMVT